MKQLLAIVFFTFSLLLFGQGNLEFNQVLTPNITISGSITFSNGVSSILSSSNLTVPTGKVWKIEYLFPLTVTQFSCSNCSGSGGSWGISGIKIITKLNGNKFCSEKLDENIAINPIWLKGGDNLQFTTSQPSGNPYTGSYTGIYNVALSIIEFNVVP